MKETDLKIERVERKGWVLTALLLLASLPFRSLPVTAGAVVGALLALLNFMWLRDFAGALLAVPGKGTSKLLVLLYLFKYVFTGAVLLVIIKYRLADPFALLAGISVVFAAICWEGVAAHRKLREETYHAS